MNLRTYLDKMGREKNTTYKWDTYLERNSFHIRVYDDNTGKVIIVAPIEPYERMGNLYFFERKGTKYVFEFFM